MYVSPGQRMNFMLLDGSQIGIICLIRFRGLLTTQGIGIVCMYVSPGQRMNFVLLDGLNYEQQVRLDFVGSSLPKGYKTACIHP